MDPAEAGEWLSGRPKQLVFLAGLDPFNRKSHKPLVDAFNSRTPTSLPLNLRQVTGELDLPPKRERSNAKGILRLDWPTKYLERVPSLIVLFLDLDWDHTSWAEKKTEAESKCASIRASCRQGSRLAVVLLQERAVPTPSDDPLATDRAHELCHVCQLSPKQLFVVPVLCPDLLGYIGRLETAFHELAQGFYQQKLKAIRARSIPNNSPALVVRQLFKLAFLSELRQDTHTALRNYRLAYEQCKENIEHWDGIDIFEWRSVAGLLNYKWCELCFLHSTAVEAINQMRKHQTTFFSMNVGVYPTPQLASIEHNLWKAKQCYNFAKLFEKAVADGLTALATLNPGSHLDMAASIYSQANQEIATLKQNFPAVPYPSPDPLAAPLIFLGQRPWRVGFDGLAPAEMEANATNAIVHRLLVNHGGVIELLSAAMTQYRRYGCGRMQLKVMNEMANVYCSSGDIAKALQLWCLTVREGLPPVIRASVLQRACWAAYSTATVKDFLWCGIQLASKELAIAQGMLSVISGSIPPPPFDSFTNDQILAINQLWQTALTEKHEYVLQTNRVDTFLQVEASFLHYEFAESTDIVRVHVQLSSSALLPINVSSAVLHFDLNGTPLPSTDGNGDVTCEIKNLHLAPNTTLSFVCSLDLSKASLNNAETIRISKMVVALEGRQPLVSASVEIDLLSRNQKPSCGAASLKLAKRTGGITSVGDLSVSCLVGEVAESKLQLKNSTARTVNQLRLEFKRNEQSSTAAAAVLFVDDANELRSELVVPINCPTTVEAGQTISVPVRFSAQLVGDTELWLEASHVVAGEFQKRVSKLRLAVTAREPFSVTSQVLTMNGVPVTSLLNHNEHVLKADISSNADIVISRVEWLLADVVSSVDQDPADAKGIEDKLCEGDVISYCRAVSVESREVDVETPLGRMAVEWHREGSLTSVRSVVALCRLPAVDCPVAVCAKVLDTPAVVRQPIRVQYTLINKTSDVVELTALFDLTDNFMFCGDKKVTFRLLPGSSRVLNVVVMALAGGRLSFPSFSLKSEGLVDSVLQQGLRTLPASLFVLPSNKDAVGVVESEA